MIIFWAKFAPWAWVWHMCSSISFRSNMHLFWVVIKFVRKCLIIAWLLQGLNGEFRCILPDEIEEYSNEKDKYYFVCEDFSSGIYDKLHKKRCKIVGAPYVISMYRLSRELPELHRPIYNRAMIGVCLCFTGFKNKEEMSRLCRLVHHMGGSVKKEFSGQITHLVASCIYQGSIKYKVISHVMLFFTYYYLDVIHWLVLIRSTTFSVWQNFILPANAGFSAITGEKVT